MCPEERGQPTSVPSSMPIGVMRFFFRTFDFDSSWANANAHASANFSLQ